MISLSAVIPAYNEEDNVGEMIEALAATLEPITADYEIVVVDDGSRDRTALVMSEYASRYPRVRLVRHDINQGYGAAVLTGLTTSVKDWIFFTDADRQFDLNEVHRLLSLAHGTDLIVGYRAPRRDPFTRRLNGWGWSTLVNTLFGYTARDIDCAFKLIRREVVANIQHRIVSRGRLSAPSFSCSPGEPVIVSPKCRWPVIGPELQASRRARGSASFCAHFAS